VLLNHGLVEQTLVAPKHSWSGKAGLPRRIRVGMFQAAGQGEDGPVELARRERDGWWLVDSGQARPRLSGGWDMIPPRALLRRSERAGATLSEQLVGIATRGKAFWEVTYSLSFESETRDLGVLDWAEWDLNGDLLLGRDGRLFRLPRTRLRDPDAAREIADLRGLKFVARKAPPSALTW
jgi:hypothetical protein